jgi:3-hydroxyacyl-CoA dehydrogenase
MSGSILVLGSGKMAADIGGYLVGRGAAITFASQSASRLEHLRGRVTRACRRLERASVSVTAPRFSLIESLDRAPVDCVIECVRESLADKQATFAAVSHAICPATMVLSNSSSILPSHIAPRCLGLHFFYPVQLTGVAELIVPDELTGRAADEVRTQCARWSLSVVQEDERTAFAVNRLLLPLQAEAMRLLQDGVAPDMVESVSPTPLTPFGQLSFMDSVGFDVVLPAVRNYVARMPAEEARHYRQLIEGLMQLVALDKHGATNQNGFLCGEPLPWPSRAEARIDTQALSMRCAELMVDTCTTFVQRGELTQPQLDLVASGVFGANMTLAEAVYFAGHDGHLPD